MFQVSKIRAISAIIWKALIDLFMELMVCFGYLFCDFHQQSGSTLHERDG